MITTVDTSATCAECGGQLAGLGEVGLCKRCDAAQDNEALSYRELLARLQRLRLMTP